MELLGFLVIGLLAGWIAGVIMRGHGFGIIGDIVVGIVGAFIGGMIFRSLDVHTGGAFGSLVTATIGAVVLLALAGFLRKA